MEQENKWENYPNIDWQLLAKGLKYYEDFGYKRIEVPWAVTRDVAELTMPKDAEPICAGELILVGSAEQGFLAIEELLSPSHLYCSISPCFRGEDYIVRGHTQLTFMKIELFGVIRNNAPDLTLRQIIFSAKNFFEDNLPRNGSSIELKETDIGYDIEINGVEVGSYGTRTVGNKTWVYGTGLAEPRFSYALKQVQK